MSDGIGWGWSVRFSDVMAGRDIEAGLELARAAGIKAVEGNVRAFGGRETNAEALRSVLGDASVAVTSFHLPYGPEDDLANFYESGRRKMVDVITQWMEFATALGAGICIQHPTTNVMNVDIEGVDPYIRQLGRSLETLLPRAEALGITLAIENMLPGVHRGRFGSRPEHIQRMAAEFDHPNLGFCLDTGHALCAMGPGRAAEIPAAMGRRIAAFHLADNAGDRDMHLAPGRGLVNWPAVFATAVELGFDRTMCIEAPPFAPGPVYSADAWRQLIADTEALVRSAVQGRG